MRPKKISFIIRRYGFSVKRLIVVVAVGLLSSYFYKTLNTKGVFTITNYTYSGVVKYVNQEDIEKVIIANVANRNYFTLNARELEKTLTENFLAIKYAKIIKKPFKTIEIQIQERVPVAVVVDTEQQHFLIDTDGFVLGLIDSGAVLLPTLTYGGKVFVGKFIDKNIVPIALDILNSAKVEHVDVSSLSFQPEYASFYSSGVQILLGYARESAQSLKIIVKLFQEHKNITKIDLRYEKVIVSYE